MNFNMNFNIIKEFRLNKYFSFILTLFFIYFLYNDKSIPKINIYDNKIKEIYSIIFIFFIGILIYILFDPFNFILYLVLIFEIIKNSANTEINKKTQKNKPILKNKIDETIRKNITKEKNLSNESLSSSEENENVEFEKKYENNDRNINYDLTLEENLVNKSYFKCNKENPNPTPKYQAILPNLNCSYID